MQRDRVQMLRKTNLGVLHAALFCIYMLFLQRQDNWEREEQLMQCKFQDFQKHFKVWDSDGQYVLQAEGEPLLSGSSVAK